MMSSNRRDFLKKLGLITTAFGIAPDYAFGLESRLAKDMFFEISLAEWSLHKSLFAKEFDNLDFPVKARKDFGIGAVEYVNAFFKDKAEDTKYLNALNTRADDNGVKNLLIMIDGEGALGDQDQIKRKEAIENHYKWITAAKHLGCHSIRVNAGGKGKPEDVASAVVDSLATLTEFSAQENINVIVENHGGPSSNGAWLARIMKAVNNPYCGTLPDFGNFHISKSETYNRYKGVAELMPYAKGVSAKSHDFDANGNETATDYLKMLKIVQEAGYNGYVGIEYEGKTLSEPDGIMATKALLEKVGVELS